MEHIRNGFHRHRSGDLIIEVLPGWTVMKENSNDNRVVRAAAIATPLILLGKGIKPEIIRMPVAIDRVAPTLSSAMRIRAPMRAQPHRSIKEQTPHSPWQVLKIISATLHYLLQNQ